MSSTSHSGMLICRKCSGRDCIKVERMQGDKYVCECACGHVYLSKSVAAGAEYLRKKQHDLLKTNWEV